ncbi:Metallo-hydrolase/oxidoreductase [Neoconidiobolus thromboides FSU 785]|nr:Metallo-hydrolase/oxidoreductase [Neoconidiobolus thromboides FSU 785]
MENISASFGSDLKRSIEVICDADDILEITPLGAGNEVGRSCIILSFKGKTVMLDAGIHPAHEGIAGLPFYDNIDPDTVDLVLISHFHLDHAASLPYFMEKTSYSNPVYMTHPTKAIYKWFLTDYVRVSTASVDDMLFDEQDLLHSYEKISVVDYHQEVDVDGIKFTPYNAGHVLGAAMFLIEIAGVKVLYTGDYSREEDRHLMAAERPSHVTPEVLICEATYGNQAHEPRLEREARFTSSVHKIVSRGGRCLIPVFALGRAQELLLILDEYWQAHPELDHVPIYFASSLAKKCMAVYQTYINMMNQHIRNQFSSSNPFVFKHIANLRHINSFEDNGPCVMVASPGMLQNGLSRELFERWCPDDRNGLLLCGYSVEGTLARTLLSSPAKVPSMRGGKLPLKMEVEYISFSAHVDFNQNSKFIDLVAAPNLVLVHGEPIPMSRLKQKLCEIYVNPLDPATVTKEDLDPNLPRRRRMAIYTPKNTETVRLPFKAEKMAKTVGKLANKEPTEGTLIEGIIVGRDFQYRIMEEEDLEDLAGLPVAEFHQRQSISFHAKFSLITTTLKKMFGNDSIQVVENGIEILDVVKLIDSTHQGEVDMEWLGNEANDMVADGILATILQISCSPSSIKLTYEPHSHGTDDKQKLTISKIDKLLLVFGELFDSVQLIESLSETTEKVILIESDQQSVMVNTETFELVDNQLQENGNKEKLEEAKGNEENKSEEDLNEEKESKELSLVEKVTTLLQKLKQSTVN